MAENLDDDVPFEALPPVITSAKAEPRRSKPARETARDAETPHGPPPAPIPDDAGAELALISAIMGDGGGGSRTCIPTLEPEAFTGAEARALWSAFRADVDPDDLITLSEKSGVPLPRLIAIADLDRAGATFSSGLKAVVTRARNLKVKKLGAMLAEQPELAEVLGPQIVKLTAADLPVQAGRALADFHLLPRNDRSVLLGNRYLVRGDGAILVGTSGMGKSSLSLQMAVLWALGREAMGIKPNGPLKSLFFQSEDSDGDVAEVWASIDHVLKLTKSQRETVRKHVIIVTDRQNRGETFIAAARRQIALHVPDLVWVNPLAAFMGGDISDAEQAGKFLRQDLNGLNSELKFAWMLVHHTTKPPTDKGKTERKWSEVMYDMAGSYDLIGWARAILSLRATENQGEFELMLAKRGTRADVKVEKESDAGIVHFERTTVIPLKWADGEFEHPDTGEKMPLIFWEGRTAKAKSTSLGRPREKGIENYMVIIPTTPDKAMGIRQMHRLAAEIMPISIGSFFNLINKALEDGLLMRDLSNPRLPKFCLNTNPKTSG